MNGSGGIFVQRVLASLVAVALLVGFHFVFSVSIFGPLGLMLSPVAMAVCPAAVADSDLLPCFSALQKILDPIFLAIITAFLLRYVDTRNGRTSNYALILLQTILTIVAVALFAAYQDYKYQEDLYQSEQREIALLLSEDVPKPTRVDDIEQLRIGEENLQKLTDLKAGRISAIEYVEFTSNNAVKYPPPSSFRGGVERFPDQRDLYIENIAAQNEELKKRIARNEYQAKENQEKTRADFLVRTSEPPHFWDSFVGVFIYRR